MLQKMAQQPDFGKACTGAAGCRTHLGARHRQLPPQPATSPVPWPPQPGPALVTQSPRQGCGKGFLLEPSTKLETGEGTRRRRASEPRTPHQPQGGQAVGDPQCRLTTGGHQRTQPGREAREKALPSPPAARTGRLTFPAASRPAPSQPQLISRPQTPSRGWVASGFIPQRPENAPAIAEPLQKPPAQGPVVPGLVGGEGPVPALELLGAPCSLSIHPLPRDGDLGALITSVASCLNARCLPCGWRKHAWAVGGELGPPARRHAGAETCQRWVAAPTKRQMFSFVPSWAQPGCLPMLIHHLRGRLLSIPTPRGRGGRLTALAEARC